MRLDRAFIIVLENDSQQSVSVTDTPYITSLAQQYGEATDYFGVTHPSEPNYIAIISGSNWWTTTTTRRTGSITPTWSTSWRRATSAGRLHGGAASRSRSPTLAIERRSAVCVKHNPFALFTDIRDNPARVANIKPYTALAATSTAASAPVREHRPGPVQRHARGVNTAVAGHPETPCPFNSTNDDPNDVHLKQNLTHSSRAR